MAAGMAIARRELGSSTAPALVLIHGLGASGRAFDLVAPLLAARFRVIVPDLPGFGRSGAVAAGGAYTMETLAGALVTLADGLRIDRFAAAGLSMGG